MTVYKCKDDVRITANFRSSEFMCRCGKCDGGYVEEALVVRLQKLREWLGRPLRVQSGYRCAAHNKAVGGVQSSQHKLGKAADIDLVGIPPVTLQDNLHFGGVGIYKTFTHVDIGARRQWNG